MKHKIAVTRGTGNVFRDTNRPLADIEQLRAKLAAQIIRLLDKDEIAVRAAQAKTGIAAADFSRIRNADLNRFTVDRLMAAIILLGARIDVAVKVKRAA